MNMPYFETSAFEVSRITQVFGFVGQMHLELLQKNPSLKSGRNTVTITFMDAKKRKKKQKEKGTKCC